MYVRLRYWFNKCGSYRGNEYDNSNSGVVVDHFLPWWRIQWCAVLSGLSSSSFSSFPAADLLRLNPSAANFLHISIHIHLIPLFSKRLAVSCLSFSFFCDFSHAPSSFMEWLQEFWGQSLVHAASDFFPRLAGLVKASRFSLNALSFELIVCKSAPHHYRRINLLWNFVINVPTAFGGPESLWRH